MPVPRDITLESGEPPVAPLYHRIFVPVAFKSATVGDAAEQKLCAEAVGEDGVEL